MSYPYGLQDPAGNESESVRMTGEPRRSYLQLRHEIRNVWQSVTGGCEAAAVKTKEELGSAGAVGLIRKSIMGHMWRYDDTNYYDTFPIHQVNTMKHPKQIETAYQRHQQTRWNVMPAPAWRYGPAPMNQDIGYGRLEASD